MSKRAAQYANGSKPSVKAQAFTVSVGNIAWGGTGKTPVVDLLLDWCQQQKLRSAVLTRGYGGKSTTRPLLVTSNCQPTECGDEPLMLHKMHPETTILVDPERCRALHWLEGEEHAYISKPEVILLDDAMQHMAVERDINLVLLRQADITSEWDKVIPAGSWREGKDALNRADAFLLRASANEFEQLLPAINNRLAGFKKPVFLFDLQPTGLKMLGGDGVNITAPALDKSTQSPYAVCCAVGNPASVIKSVEGFMGYPPLHCVFKEDHHPFSLIDLQKLSTLRMPVIITSKDAVKIEKYLDNSIVALPRVYVLEVKAQISTCIFSATVFTDWLADKYKTHTKPSSAS